jgi:hypothetical protein
VEDLHYRCVLEKTGYFGPRAHGEFCRRAPRSHTAPGYRVIRPLDIEWLVVFAEGKLFVAIRRCDAAEHAAGLLVIGARRKPQVPGIANRVLGQLARRGRRHSHCIPVWEKPMYKIFLVIGNTAEAVETRVLHPQAEHVKQEKPSLNATVSFKSAHDKLTAAGIKEVAGTKCFERMIHISFDTRCRTYMEINNYILWFRRWHHRQGGHGFLLD